MSDTPRRPQSLADVRAGDEVVVTAARDAVRDEYGSHLCEWVDGGSRRQCRKISGLPCTCGNIARAVLAAITPPDTFQRRVAPWMQACFGAEISADRTERNHRFLEEALELVQASGCTSAEARQLVDYVYGRPIGDVNQEIGGVMVTLAALCLANGTDMHSAGETELQRVWGKVEQIRAKQAAKPKHSPLPGPSVAIRAGDSNV